MRTTYPIALSGLARKTAERASDFAGVVGNLIRDVRDCYRPGLHEMRGPRPQMVRQLVRQRRMPFDL
jgi:hypothetical protein